MKFDHARIFFPMYANFFQTTPDSLTSFKCGHLQKNIYIYKYIFRSNSRGLAPLGPARPDKFINLATLGPSALASRGINRHGNVGFVIACALITHLHVGNDHTDQCLISPPNTIAWLNIQIIRIQEIIINMVYLNYT